MLTLEEIEDILRQINYKNWVLKVSLDGHRAYIQASWFGKCSVEGHEQEWKSRKWYLSFFMCRDEIVKTAFKMIETAELHEVREFFKYKGKAIFGPHVSCEALLEVADRIEVREEA